MRAAVAQIPPSGISAAIAELERRRRLAGVSRVQLAAATEIPRTRLGAILDGLSQGEYERLCEALQNGGDAE